MPNGRPPEITGDFQAAGRITYVLMREISLSPSNFPHFLFVPFLIEKDVLFDPPDHKGDAKFLHDFQPWTRSISTIKHRGY
jgi:hypothetical protein